ncbi:MAG: DUF4330 domain-containing protein [Eubacteriales bacterium]
MEKKKATGAASRRRSPVSYVIDIVLLAIIIGAATLLIYIFTSSGGSGKLTGAVTKNIEYTVLLSEVRDQFKGLVGIGDSVTDTVKLMPIGEVVDIKYEDTIRTIEDSSTGTLKYAVMPDKFDMFVTVKAAAQLENGYYYIDGYQISVGTLVSLRVPEFTGSGYCTAIREVSE